MDLGATVMVKFEGLSDDEWDEIRFICYEAATTIRESESFLGACESAKDSFESEATCYVGDILLDKLNLVPSDDEWELIIKQINHGLGGNEASIIVTSGAKGHDDDTLLTIYLAL